MGGSGKGGPELKRILQKHRLDFKYGVWAKNLASLFISIGYSLPGRAEVSRLAETTPMSKAEQTLPQHLSPHTKSNLLQHFHDAQGQPLPLLA